MKKQLLFYNTGKPSFLSVRNLDMGFVDPNDHLIAYSEADNVCYGSYPIKSNGYNFVMAMGNDNTSTKKDGFDYQEDIKLAIYDKQTDTIFKLDCIVKDWQGKTTELKYMNLGVFIVEIIDIGEPINLDYHEELAKVIITIEGEDEGEADMDPYFFKLKTQNVNNPIVVASMGGQIVEGQWWIKDQNMLATHKYIPVGNEKNVTITSIGTDAFTGQMVTAAKLVKFSEEQQPEPPNEITIAENEFFRIYKKEFRSFGEFIFFQNNKNAKQSTRLIYTKDSGSKTSNSVITEKYGGKNDTDRSLKASDYKTITVGYTKLIYDDIGVKYERINETYII